MAENDAGDTDSGVHNCINSSHSSGVESSSEAIGAYRRSEYPSMVTTESYPMRSGPCPPYYGQGPVGYTDYPDRYSMGYQRMGQTITLTSHKIQFGCQGNANSGFANQRCGAPLRHQYMIPPAGKPTWMEPCPERSQSNSKSNNRGRTTYSDDQIAELESVFNSNPYPTSQTRQRLAYKIDVPEGKVKIWFQNRRARAKKSKLSCVIPWRNTIGDSNALDERGNQNNNNGKEMSNKSNSSEPNIPIASILPLPTKTSITNSALVSCVPAWRGYYDLSTRNQSCSRDYHQNIDCSMRGTCSCSDLTAHYPIRVGADRFMHTPRSMSNPMCYENRTYAANGLRSPPPIRRLIYPFHTLTQKSLKSEQGNQFTQEAACTSRGAYSFGDSGVESSSIHSNSADAIANSSATYSELRQYTTSDWESSQGQGTSGVVNYPKAMANDAESGFGSEFVRSCAVVPRSGGRRESSTTSPQVYRNDDLVNCLKTENNMDLDCEKASLSLAENEPADRSWNGRGSSNILVKAMEYTAGDRNMEQLTTSSEQASNVQTDTNAVGSHELSEIWPPHFPASICAPAAPSIVG